MEEKTKAILIIDGYCYVCNALVSFINRKDRNNRFYFTHLQSEFASKNSDVQKYIQKGIDSVILITPDNKSYIYSDAVIESFKLLGTPYSWLTYSRIIPQCLRDLIYRGFGKIRYMFGRKPDCELPDKELKSKILK